jgi:hypothetical protein
LKDSLKKLLEIKIRIPGWFHYGSGHLFKLLTECSLLTTRTYWKLKKLYENIWSVAVKWRKSSKSNKTFCCWYHNSRCSVGTHFFVIPVSRQSVSRAGHKSELIFQENLAVSLNFVLLSQLNLAAANFTRREVR